MRRGIAIAIVAILCSAAGAARAATIWIEGENAAVNRMTRHGWYDAVKKHQLSAGNWISHFNDKKQGEAEYRFEAPQAGEYSFWLRANPVKSSLSYKLDDGMWKPIDLSDPIENTNIAADGKPDLRFVAWLDVGKITLSKGRHTIAFRTQSKLHHHGAIDCFVLTTEYFRPRGLTRPDGGPAPQVVSDKGTWAFRPALDRYSDQAMLDLRDLNEKIAGQSGFIRLSSDERDFVKGDGSPIRFWAAHSSVYRLGRAALDDHARFLAKRGVNVVRWHGSINAKNEGSKLTDIDPKARDQLWQYVAAMKKQGIYMTLSPYYPHRTKVRKSWGIDSPQENMTCLLFFDPRVQSAYKQWLREIFVPRNPYTGIPLKDEPAVAIIQIQNEDSMLFWTISAVKGREAKLLQKQFGDWLKRRYGTIGKALAAYRGFKHKDDDPDSGHIGLFHIWELTSGAVRQLGRPTGGKAVRLADQTRFFVETMRNWNAEVVRFLREEIGAKQLVNAGNWKTADSVLLGDLERYSYTSTQVLGVNRYMGDVHVGKHRGWAIVNGDRFLDRSALLRPEALPVNLKQVAGYPIIIPESNWVPPMGHQSEGPFLVSAYMSLTGVDAFYWFNMGQPQFRDPSSANGYLPSLGKWVANTPQIAGNFPAAALMFRKGYIARGKTVVHEQRRLEDMWQRRVPIIAEQGSYDPNRDKGDYAPQSNIKQDIDRLAFLVGPVEVTYGDSADSRVSDLSPYIDRRTKTVRSVTGQLRWDYANGICTLDAPKAKGASGFLGKRGALALGDVLIKSGNEYATVLVVAMDDQPIGSSRRILVQVGTIARPTDWAVRDVTWQDKQSGKMKGLEIVNYGKPPWRITNNDMTITLTNPRIATATALDMNGMAQDAVPIRRSGAKLTVTLPKSGMYFVLDERPASGQRSRR